MLTRQPEMLSFSVLRPTGGKAVLSMLFVAATSFLSAYGSLVNIGNTPAIDTDPEQTGAMTGSAVLGTTPNNTTDYWNMLDLRDQSSFSDLKTATLGSFDGSLSKTGFQGENFSGADSVGGLAPALFENFAYEFAQNGGTSTLSFSGLTDGAAYTLVLYNLNDGSHADTTYTINGVTKVLEQVGNANYTSTLDLNASEADAALGSVYSGNYVEFTGTVVDGSLNITLALAPSNTSNNGPQPASYMAFTGLQLEVVPEPSTFALMAAGLGSLAFLIHRRRNFFLLR